MVFHQMLPVLSASVAVSILLFFNADVTQSFTIIPSNTAAVAGSKVILNATSTSTHNVSWFLNGADIGSCGGVPAPVSPYSLSSPTTDECDLIINPITADQAGVYSCAAPGETTYYAQVIVIGQASCSTVPSSGTIYVDQIVTMTTTAAYDAGTDSDYFDPFITWTSTGSFASTPFLNSTFIGSAAVTQAPIPQIPAYSSAVVFIASSTTPPADYSITTPGTIQLCSFGVLTVTNATEPTTTASSTTSSTTPASQITATTNHGCAVVRRVTFLALPYTTMIMASILRAVTAAI